MASKLRLETFRSFADRVIELADKTALVGKNGAGKSNVVEALRLLSVGKSFKTSRLDDAIQFEAPYFRLTERFAAGPNKEVSLFYGLPYPTEQVRQRSLRIDGQETAWSEYWGVRPSVLFVPGDIDIVLGAPQLRRRYLDSILWQTSAAFRADHTELGRVLRERSALLFLLKVNRAGISELHPWNELLVRLTESVRRHRKTFIDFLNDELVKNPTVFTSGAVVRVAYEEGPTDPSGVQREEIRLSQNLIGPHRDELDIRFNDQSARRFTSRGQARAIILLLKLAEARFLARLAKTKPVILLDDMFSELDQPTAEALFGQFDPDYPIVATSITPNPLTTAWATVDLP